MEEYPTHTKYAIMKRCLQCFKINDGSLSKCSQCNCLFTTEANFDELQQANTRLIEIQKKRGEN